MYKVLLISGKQGSGKTTLQNEIVKALQPRPGIRVITINFADIIYEMHNYCVGRLATFCPEYETKKDGPLLQLLGTEWGRAKDPDIWVKCLKGKIEKMMKDLAWAKEVLFIIGDCRFENEFDAFPDALTVRLECSEEVRKKRCPAWRENTTHPSEIGLDKYSEEKKFDIYLSTMIFETDYCREIVLGRLLGES